MKEKKLEKFQNKLRNDFIKKGVKMIAPETVFFSNDTKIGKKVVIEPYVVISKNVKIGNNVTVSSFSHLEGVKIENNIESIIQNVDASIIVTAHDEFKKLEIPLFSKMRNPILIDTRGIVDPLSAKETKLIFRGLGRGE